VPRNYNTQLYWYSSALHPDCFQLFPLQPTFDQVHSSSTFEGWTARDDPPEIPVDHLAEAQSVIKATFS
jgi:hypothetical protein